jgi:hypothetical protein
MKKKAVKNPRKLQLNKETLERLGTKDLRRVAAGRTSETGRFGSTCSEFDICI